MGGWTTRPQRTDDELCQCGSGVRDWQNVESQRLAREIYHFQCSSRFLLSQVVLAVFGYIFGLMVKFVQKKQPHYLKYAKSLNHLDRLFMSKNECDITSCFFFFFVLAVIKQLCPCCAVSVCSWFQLNKSDASTPWKTWIFDELQQKLKIENASCTSDICLYMYAL